MGRLGLRCENRDGCFAFAVLLGELLKSISFKQRRVTASDYSRAVEIFEGILSGHNSVASAEMFCLDSGFEVKFGLLGFVGVDEIGEARGVFGDDDDLAFCAGFGKRLADPSEHRLASKRMQGLRQSRVHALAVSCCQNNRYEFHFFVIHS